MNGLIYLLQVNLYLLLFYLFYLVLLRNETFFRLNRIYSVSSGILSLLIPVLRSDWIRELFVTEEIYAVTQSVGSTIVYYSAPSVKESEGLSLEQLIWLFYAVGAGIAALQFGWRLFQVSMSFKSKRENQAFSFFNKISVDQNLPDREVIIQHELVHVKQWHSADVIFFELFTIVNWFNPVAYLYKKAIKNIHEFIADETAAEADKASYAMLLLTNTFGIQPQQLTNSFFNQSILKRRIFMLHKTKSRRAAILKYGLSAPLFASMVIFSSATLDKSETVIALGRKVKAQLPALLPLDNKNSTGGGSGDYNEAESDMMLVSPTNSSHQIEDSTKTRKANNLKPVWEITADDSIHVHADTNIVSAYGNPKITLNPKGGIPLIIIDGLSVSTAKTEKAFAGKQYINALVPSEDIHSIAVIKDKSSTERYGEKGRNGVVEITTKAYAKIHPEGLVNIKVKAVGRTLPHTTASSFERTVTPLTNAPQLSENSLYIINDKEISHEEFKIVSKEPFESIMFLWGKHAAKYGEKGKNGVWVATTKATVKGYSGEAPPEKQGYLIMNADRSKPDKIVYKNIVYFLNEKRITKDVREKLDPKNIKSIEEIKDKAQFGSREVPAGTERIILIELKE
ncbi:MAG TPA: M56 family metallopeptidase [Pedobacter sp.]|jgi:hypothetical protein